MKRNIEIKARARDLQALVERANGIADSGPTIIDQEDTFFRSQRGRLKLRRFSDSAGELIYYSRPDTVRPAECRYIVAMTSAPNEMYHVLSASLGVRGVVRKRRTVYVVGQTRIHLDEVEGLGQFLELEVVLHQGQSVSDGVQIVQDLMEKLEVADGELVEQAYIDLIEQDAG